MYLRHGFTSLMGVLALSFAFSQTCDALLTHGLYNVSIATDVRKEKAAEYSKICNSDFSSSSQSTQRQIQGSLSYAGFGIGAGSSRSFSNWQEAQQTYCEENQSNEELDVSTFREARQIYDRGIQAWERCVELSSRNVLIDFAVNESSANATTVTYGISYTGAGTSGIELRGIYVRPEDAFKCEGQLGENNQNIEVDENTRRPITPQNLAITCERNITSRNSDEDLVYYKPATISIHTTDRNLDAFFPGIQVSSSINLLSTISELDNNVRDLETRLHTANTRVVDLEAMLATSNSSATDLQAQLETATYRLSNMQIKSGLFTVGAAGLGRFVPNFPSSIDANTAAQSLNPGWTVHSIDLVYDIPGGCCGNQMYKAIYTLIP